MPKHMGFVIKICEECGNDFTVKVSYDKHNPARFCTNKCRMAWRGRELQATLVYPDRIKRTCERCKKAFYVQPNALKREGGGTYCSWECRKNRIDNTCKQCGCTYKIQVCEKRWGSDKFCSKACYSKWMSDNIKGSNHPNYLGDDHQRVYPVEFNSIRESIRERDGRSCQYCGVTEKEKKLCVHHIDYNKNNLAKENLVTLCQSCHSKTNFRRDTWEYYFLKNQAYGVYEGLNSL